MARRNRLTRLALGLALATTSVMAATATATGQEGEERDPTAEGTRPTSNDGTVGASSVTCNFPLGGSFAGARHFSTCISNHGNVVNFRSGGGGTGTVYEHVGFGTVGEGYFVHFDQDSASFRCFWDAGYAEHGSWVDISAAPSGSGARVVRQHDLGAWELEQIFGVNQFTKVQKVIMIYKNLSGVNHTGVRLGRHVDIDAESSSGDDVFLFSDEHSSVLGVDSETGPTTGTGMTIIPRAYGSSPRVAVQTFGNWFLDTDSDGTPDWADPDHAPAGLCQPNSPQTTSPTAVGDHVAWAYNELGFTGAGSSKLVIFEERAM